MKRQEVKEQWKITPDSRYPNYEMCEVYDLYKMNISDVADMMGKNYKGTYGTSKDGSKVYEDEIIRVVLCDEESTRLLYRRPINPLSVRILCPVGAKFKQDEKGRDLYNMKAQIHSIDDSQYGIWFHDLPYSKLEYIRKLILEYVDENYLINGEDFLTFCELIGGVDKDYN